MKHFLSHTGMRCIQAAAEGQAMREAACQTSFTKMQKNSSSVVADAANQTNIHLMQDAGCQTIVTHLQQELTNAVTGDVTCQTSTAEEQQSVVTRLVRDAGIQTSTAGGEGTACKKTILMRWGSKVLCDSWLQSHA